MFDFNRELLVRRERQGDPISFHFKASLPRKFHDVMTVALRDEQKAFKSPLYEMDMGQWHRPDWKTREDVKAKRTIDPRDLECSVCFAGAVMAFSLDADPRLDLGPMDWNGGSPTENKLKALDAVREGNIEDALFMVYPDCSEKMTKRIQTCCRELQANENFTRQTFGEYDIDVTDYHCDRTEWRRQMFIIRNKFKKHNL